MSDIRKKLSVLISAALFIAAFVSPFNADMLRTNAESFSYRRLFPIRPIHPLLTVKLHRRTVRLSLKVLQKMIMSH